MDTPQTVNQQEAKPARRFSGIAQAVLVGGGFAGGGTAVYALIEVIRSEPDKAFRLLHDWGPWCFLSMFVAYAISKIANRGLDVAESVSTRIADAMDRVATQQEGQASAMRDQASALQKSADKDDRNLQELQTLTSLTAQRSEKTYAMMQSFHDDNRIILQQQQATLDRIEAKVDGRIEAKADGKQTGTERVG
jgi:hypothetical protein